MGYINYEIMTSKHLNLHEVGVLQLVKQNRIEDLSEQIKFEISGTPFVEKMSEIGYIEEIKGSAKDGLYKKLRISKKGNDVLDDINTPNTTEEQLKMRDYLVEMYLNHEDKERIIGSKKTIATYITILQHYLEIDIYQFYYLCEYFLSQYPFTKKLENLFWDKNKQRYKEFKNNIEDSTIYQFYDQHKEEIENYWKQRLK